MGAGPGVLALLRYDLYLPVSTGNDIADTLQPQSFCKKHLAMSLPVFTRSDVNLPY